MTALICGAEAVAGAATGRDVVGVDHASWAGAGVLPCGGHEITESVKNNVKHTSFFLYKFIYQKNIGING